MSTEEKFVQKDREVTDVAFLMNSDGCVCSFKRADTLFINAHKQSCMDKYYQSILDICESELKKQVKIVSRL